MILINALSLLFYISLLDKGSLNNNSTIPLHHFTGGDEGEEEDSCISSSGSINHHSNGSGEKQSSSASTNEQYVTVITLNDSTYGEIQRQQKSTTTQIVQQQKSELPKIKDSSSSSFDQVESNDEEMATESTTASTEVKTEPKVEPIYLNTLESQKNVDKGLGLCFSFLILTDHFFPTTTSCPKAATDAAKETTVQQASGQSRGHLWCSFSLDHLFFYHFHHFFTFHC